ncbi:hypothetical protein ACQP1U_09380 [Actinomycetota bacterium]
MSDTADGAPALDTILDRLVSLGLTTRASADAYQADIAQGPAVSADPRDIAFEVMRWEDGRATVIVLSSDEHTHLRDPESFFESYFGTAGDRITDVRVTEDDFVTVEFAVDGLPQRLRYEAPMEVTDVTEMRVVLPDREDGTSPQIIDVTDDAHGLRFVYADPDTWQAFLDWADGRA